MLFSVLSVGSLGRCAVPRPAATRSPAASSSASAAAFGLAMLALWRSRPNLPSPSRSAVLVGLTSITFMTSSTAIVQLLAGPEYRGRVLAIQAMVFLGSTPIGGPIIGWIADAAGARMAIVVGAGGCLVAAAYGAKALDVRRRGHHEAAPVAAPAGTSDAVSLAGGG